MAALLKAVLLALLALATTAWASGLYGAKGSSVIVLDEKNFNKLVVESPHLWLVEFYAPWCGHCKNLAPEYEKAATNLKNLVKVGAINCDEEKTLCGQYGIQGFPTIKIFPAEGTASKSGKVTKTPTDYQGERTARAIVDNVLSHLPVYVKKVHSGTSTKSTLNIEDFLSQNAGTQAHALLFSSKATTAPLFKALAVDFKDRLLMGEVKSSDKALVDRYAVSQFPTLLVLPKDDPTAPIRFEGTLSHDALVAFLEPHALPAPQGSGSGSGSGRPAGGSSGSDASSFNPEVPQVKTQAQLDELCLTKTDGLCIIAFMDFDAEYESSVREHEANLKVLRDVKKRAHDAGRNLHVLWLDNSEQTKLRDSFGLSDFLPSVMALSPVRNLYRPMVAGFDEPNLWEFVEETQLGQGRIFRYSHQPKVA